MIFNTHYPYIGGGGGGGGAPQYEYTGQSTFIDDGGGNWRIKFLTSGTLTLTRDIEIDVFLVGGGGSGATSKAGKQGYGGGGGGYTKTAKAIKLTKNNPYAIVVGAGGVCRVSDYPESGGDGGASTAFGQNAGGGKGGQFGNTHPGAGGDGGSGGATGSLDVQNANNGGSDGGNGTPYGGRGQGTTTREFGEPTGDLYAGGGGAVCFNGYYPRYGSGGAGGGAPGSRTRAASTAETNTGGGGGSVYKDTPTETGGSGGSGIVIIRNAR